MQQLFGARQCVGLPLCPLYHLLPYPGILHSSRVPSWAFVACEPDMVAWLLSIANEKRVLRFCGLKLAFLGSTSHASECLQCGPSQCVQLPSAHRMKAFFVVISVSWNALLAICEQG